MEKLQELTRAWRFLGLRAFAALALAFVFPFASGLLKYPLLGAVSVPFMMASFAIYIVADSILLFAFACQFPPHHSVRRVLFLQASTGMVVGLSMLSVLFERATLDWFVFLSICQSALTGTFELVASTHFKRHLKDEYIIFAAGLVSLSFSVALIVLRNENMSRTLSWVITYMTFFGISMLLFSLRLCSIAKIGTHESSRIHTTAG
jgi:hypothetical protein